MSETDRWLSEYGDSHRQVCWPLVYWPAVVLLVVGTVGMLWSLPVPGEFRSISPLLNWGSAFLMAAVVYYFIISVALAIGMLPFVLGVTGIEMWIEASDLSLAGVSLGLVLVALAGLYAGQRSNGGLAALFRDVQLMMIGPAWLLANVYRKLGIPY